MSRIRLMAVCAGFGLEAYDWALYPLMLYYFAPSFFGADPRRSLVLGFAVYAAGFLTRPLGGLVLGRFADRHGRRPAMRVCLLLAGLAAAAMAVTPTSASIGVAAPVLVLLWRAILGFSFGGECPLGHSYVYETTAHHRRGAGGSLLPTASGIGAIFANLLVLTMVMTVGSHQVSAVWWRLPFVVGAVAALVFAALRSALAETGEFERHRASAVSKPSWWSERRSLLTPMLWVGGTAVGATCATHLWAGLPTAYAMSILRLNDATVLWAATTATLVTTVSLPFFGRLGDRIGCRRLLGVAALIMAVATPPLLYGLDHGGVVGYWVVVVSVHVILAAMGAPLPAVLAGFVPTRHRVTAEALPFTVAATLFGGTAPMLRQLTTGYSAWFTAYVVVLLLITAATVRWAGRPAPVTAPLVAVPATATASVWRR